MSFYKRAALYILVWLIIGMTVASPALYEILISTVILVELFIFVYGADLRKRYLERKMQRTLDNVQWYYDGLSGKPLDMELEEFQDKNTREIIRGFSLPASFIKKINDGVFDNEK